MIINPETRLLENLTAAEAEQLAEGAADAILHGDVSQAYMEVCEQWRIAVMNSDSPRLLVISTVFPQYALLSVVRFYQARMRGWP